MSEVWSDLFNFGKKKSGRRGARGDERFQTHLLTTELGNVVDISGSGMRVRAKWRMNLVEGTTIRLKVRSPQCTISTRCRVVRFAKVREAGFKGVDICLTIVDAEPGLRAALVHLGKFGFIPKARLNGSSARTGAGARQRPERVGTDYYALLGVPATATAEEIRRAFHSNAKPVHPDIAGTAAYTDQFEMLSEAYRVLRDPQRRAAYDELRRAPSAA